MSMATPPEQEIYTLMSDFNNRPDHLIAIIKHRMNIPGELGYLHLAQIDPEGKYARVFYHPPPAHKEVELKIPFDPPVRNNQEIKQRLFTWRAEAIQHFRPPASPIVDYYSPPALFPFTVPLILLLSVLLYTLVGWGHYAELFREKIREKLGIYIIPTAGIFAGLMHLVVEPLYMIMQVRKHKTPFPAACKWILTVAALGFAGINEWAECLEYERIRYIYSKTDVGQIAPKVGQGSKEKRE